MGNILTIRRVLAGLALVGLMPLAVSAMCGYFAPPRVVDVAAPAVLQPSQIAYITWDPDKNIETVTVQPRFEGNALDFGMVIPTPSQPKLDEMPRDFFKALGVYTTPKRRVIPESKLMPRFFGRGNMLMKTAQAAPALPGPGGGGGLQEVRHTTVVVLEVGQVGNLDYKIIKADRPDDLYTWLKDHKYSYSGDEATLDYYVKKKYFFTVMKIDTLQMKKNKDGSYTGDVTPTRFSFTTDKIVYPTKITQVSVKDKTEALFYVQAPFKVDLPGDLTYQFHWLSALQHTQNTFGQQDLLEPNLKWWNAVTKESPALLRRGGELGFTFPLGVKPPANKKGLTPTSLEWARRLSADDIKIIAGTVPFTEIAPDPDWGFTQRDIQDGQRTQSIMKVIQRRLARYQQDRPRGYLVREASKDDLKTLPILKGHLKEGQFLTKFYHEFTKAEMNDDLVLVAAKAGKAADASEHEELLRTLDWDGGRFGPRGPLLPMPPPRGGPLLP
jgi:hypothetical protein